MKTYLTYGVTMAVAGAVLVIVLYLLGFHSDPARLGTAQALGFVGGIVIGGICISLGTRARRDETPVTEDFGYGRALGTGVMIALVAALCGVVTTYAYAKFINPGFVEVIVQAQTAKFEAKGMSASQIEVAEKAVRTMTSPGIQALFGFCGAMILGTVISLVTAAVFKRPASPVFADAPPAVG